MNCRRNVVLAVPAPPVIRVTDGLGRPPHMSLSRPAQPVVVLSISIVILSIIGATCIYNFVSFRDYTFRSIR